MSSTSRRVAAAAVAVIIAVLTGAAAGLVSPERTCEPAGGKLVCTVALFAPVPAVVALFGALAAAALAVGVLVRGRDPVTGGSGVAGPAAGPDRAVLRDACIYVRDRTTSRALADHLGTALADAGVRTVAPTGDRFDPARHEAGGAAPSPDPAADGTIAVVDLPGYTDRDGHILRVPVVTVYRTGQEVL
jgi:hypothetical protein